LSYALALFLAHRVYVDLQISDELSSVVVAQLLFLQSESNKKPIHMYINSPGIAAVPELPLLQINYNLLLYEIAYLFVHVSIAHYLLILQFCPSEND